MKSEIIFERRNTVVVLYVRLDNLYAFKDFQLSMTYPKKIVRSSIQNEHLEGRENFRYKKVNIIMGANASGKTTFGRALMGIFNFLDKKNPTFITEAVHDRTKESSFTLDLASKSNNLYRIVGTISPKPDGEYDIEDIELAIRKEAIRAKDSYESCVKRLEESPYTPCDHYIQELDRLEDGLTWFFEYPKDGDRTLKLPVNDKKFPLVLEKILKALDPSIQKVEESQDADNAFVIRLQNESVILQDGMSFNTDRLSSGTKSGVEIAVIASALLQGHNGFYYCDEKFSYVHSDVEKAVLAVMVSSIQPNEQLFFTTHNTDILDINLPKHSFTFLRKDVNDLEHPISCINAAMLLKRSDDSLKNAVENDLFSSAPAVDIIYELTDLTDSQS